MTANNRKKSNPSENKSQLVIQFETWTSKKHMDWPGTHWASAMSEEFARLSLVGLYMCLCFALVVTLIILRGLFWASIPLWLYLLVIAAVGLSAIVAQLGFDRLLCTILPLRKRSESTQSFRPLLTETVAMHRGGGPKTVLIRKSVAKLGGNVDFEYGLNHDGDIEYQCRDNGKVCQRIVRGEGIGLHIERLTTSEIRSIRINRYWDWISRIRFIPRNARAIQILAYAYPDTPSSNFLYKVHIIFRVGGPRINPGGVLRRQFTKSNEPIHPGWKFVKKDSKDLPAIVLGHHRFSFRQCRIRIGNGEIRHIIGGGEIMH